MSPRLVLVGPPGSGKTTVGEQVAKRLDVDFRDTDRDIEASAGMLIGDIFVEHGEPHFRQLERAAIARALDEHAGVMAVGGGAILDPDTRADLARQRVVYLAVSPDQAAKRVGLDTSRPLLLGNVRGQLKKLLEARRPLYEEVATVQVSTDGRSTDEVAEIVATVVEGTP